VLLPELDGLSVRVAVERLARPALLLAQSIAHVGDGLDRGLDGAQHGVDAEDAPLRVGDIALDAVGVASPGIELLTRIEDHLEVRGERSLEALEPAGEHRQLAIATSDVAAAQQVPVIVRDARDARPGMRRVMHEEMASIY